MSTALKAGTTNLAASGQSGAPGDPYLVVDRVGKQFGSLRALQGVSLDVHAGEFVSLVGPSGCGKTTLLRAIAGLDPATSGRILQNGVDITGLPPEGRDFGIVFQSYALFPNMTVAENVGYGLRGSAWPRTRMRDRVAELLALVGLSEFRARYPSQISGGQQQRVALARALANEPGLLLLDEPLSALDAIVRVHLRSEIRALQRRLGVTTVMVTHDQEEALSVSDRIVVMSRGRIEQTGTAEEVYRQPATSFVAGFIGPSTSFDAIVTHGGVEAKGTVIGAAAAAAHAPGTEVRAFIRPEDVIVGQAAGGMAMQAEVETIEFLGATCRLSLNVGALSLSASVPTERIQPERLTEGAKIGVGVDPDRVIVFPRDA